jgi:hypothetical protein
MAFEAPAGRLRYWIALAAVLVVWLNQSIPFGEWEALQRRVFVSHEATIAETVRYPFIFLYRRAKDEELYFHLAGGMLGRSTDQALLARTREGSPAPFTMAPPPADGAWHAPYVEVPLEYPPLMLPFILLPRLLTDSLRVYCWLFGALMGACLLFGAFTVARARRLDTRASAVWLASALLLHGAIVIQRLDAVAAMLIAFAAAAWIRENKDQAAFWIGLAGAAKFLPILFVLPMLASDTQMLPGLLHQDERRDALRRCARFTSIAGAVFALGLSPFFVFSKDALTNVMQYHGLRGLHGESFFGSLYAAGASVMGWNPSSHYAFGSYNLVGTTPDSIAHMLTPLLIATMLGVTAFLVRKPPVPIEATLLIGICAVWIIGKVFSPQYLTWAIPMIPFLVGQRARGELVALLGLLGISQLYFRGYFDAVFMLEPLGIITLLVRNALLAALATGLLRRIHSLARA